MVRRLCILCFLVALWPGLGLAQSPALKDAYDNYLSRYQQGLYAEAEPYARKALELGKQEFGPDDPTTATLFANLGDQDRAEKAMVAHLGQLYRVYEEMRAAAANNVASLASAERRPRRRGGRGQPSARP